MLSLVKKSGVRTAFDYHLLTRMDFDGDSQLRLQMGDDVVILRGHAIERIFADLLTHTIFEIVEVDPLRNESSDYRHCVAQMEITSFDT